MTSTYRWRGAVEIANERQLLIKTTLAKVGELERRLKALHSYEVPEFIVVPLNRGSEAYFNWIRESC